MIHEYFQVSDHIYADLKESLRVFKAKLKFSENQLKREIPIYTKNSFLKIAP
jgi:hypothetical protein